MGAAGRVRPAGRAEASEDLALDGEVPLDGRAPGVAGQFFHPASVPVSLPSPDRYADQVNEMAFLHVALAGTAQRRLSAGGSPNGHRLGTRQPAAHGRERSPALVGSSRD